MHDLRVPEFVVTAVIIDAGWWDCMSRNLSYILDMDAGVKAELTGRCNARPTRA